MREKRIEFLAVTWSLFIVAFIIYGILGATGFNGNHLLSGLGFGFLAGYGFSSILSGCIIFARFITKKSLVFKIVCSCLFIISFGAIVYVGVFSLLPYSIYNLVKIIQNNES